MVFALLLIVPFVLATSFLLGLLFLYGRRLSPRFQTSVSGFLAQPPDLVKRRLSEPPPSDPFGGKLNFELEPRNGGTQVILFEQSHLESPLLRALAHLFVDRRSVLSKRYGLG